MFETKGRRVIITGAAQGMGKEFSKILLKSGAKVCISDIDEIKGNETKVLFQQKFGLDDSGVCFVKCNVSKKEDWPKLWDTAEILLKGPIEILINNAGLNPSVRVPRICKLPYSLSVYFYHIFTSRLTFCSCYCHILYIAQAHLLNADLFSTLNPRTNMSQLSQVTTLTYATLELS